MLVTSNRSEYVLLSLVRFDGVTDGAFRFQISRVLAFDGLVEWAFRLESPISLRVHWHISSLPCPRANDEYLSNYYCTFDRVVNQSCPADSLTFDSTRCYTRTACPGYYERASVNAECAHPRPAKGVLNVTQSPDTNSNYGRYTTTISIQHDLQLDDYVRRWELYAGPSPGSLAQLVAQVAFPATSVSLSQTSGLFDPTTRKYWTVVTANAGGIQLDEVGRLSIPVDDLNKCQADAPCKNGGTCTPTTGGVGYTCNCASAPGWTGSTCATSINDCASNPCQNGGECSDGHMQYTCTCLPGYNGTNCQINIDDCKGHACLNFGTCIDGVQTYTCQCTPQFEGSYCSIPKPCPTEIIDDVTYEATAQNDTASASCPSGLTGTVQRQCCGPAVSGQVLGTFKCQPSKYGYWMPPVLSCTDTALLALSTTVVNSSNVGNVASSLAAALTSRPGLKGASDISNGVQVLGSLVNVLSSITLDPDNLEGGPLGSVLQAFDAMLQAPTEVLSEVAGNADTVTRMTESLGKVLLSAIVGASSPSVTLTRSSFLMTAANLNRSSDFAGYNWSTPLGDAFRFPSSIFDYISSAATGGVVTTSQNQTSIFASTLAPLTRVLEAKFGGLTGDVVPLLRNFTVRLNFAVDLEQNVTSNGLLKQLAESQGLSVFDLDNVQFVRNGSIFHVTYTNLQTDSQVTINVQPTCAFWDFGRKGWSGSGCWLTDVGDSWAECTCNHLTNFACLFDMSGSGLDGSSSAAHAKALSLLTYIGLGISCTCLLLTLVILFFLRHRKWVEVSHYALMHLCTALLVAQLTFAAGVERRSSQDDGECAVTGMLLHFALLATFLWMLFEGLTLYIKFVKVLPVGLTPNQLFKKWWFVAWGTPLVIVAISGLANPTDYFSDDLCWIQSSSDTMYAFLVPVALIVATNLVVLVMVLRAVARNAGIKVAWRAFVCFFALLGATWVFGLLVAATGDLTLQYLFCIFNATQGVFLFYYHCLSRPKIRNAVISFLMCEDENASDKLMTTSSRSNARTWRNVFRRQKSNITGQTGTISTMPRGPKGDDLDSSVSSTRVYNDTGTWTTDSATIQRGQPVVLIPDEPASTMPRRESRGVSFAAAVGESSTSRSTTPTNLDVPESAKNNSYIYVLPTDGNDGNAPDDQWTFCASGSAQHNADDDDNE